MALFDFLKRKKEVEKAKEKKQEVKKTEKKTEKPLAAPKPVSQKKVGSFSYEIIKEPHVSEKSTNLSQQNKYVFKIYSNSNKPEIKKSVEGIYGVDVLSVNVIKIPKKKRIIGRSQGFKKGYNKAIVTIKEGQKIELY